ncbi:MAG: hypothetical protein NC548_32525 [Lachnospiraceae bacterium]|nr:hypothetical protein [Lachnospiraceae bacterium]
MRNKYIKSKKKHYLCNDKRIKTNRTMKPVKTEPISILKKMLEDKKAIRKCIREKGDLKKLAQKRNVQFVAPL